LKSETLTSSLSLGGHFIPFMSTA